MMWKGLVDFRDGALFAWRIKSRLIRAGLPDSRHFSRIWMVVALTSMDEVESSPV